MSVNRERLDRWLAETAWVGTDDDLIGAMRCAPTDPTAGQEHIELPTGRYPSRLMMGEDQ